MDVARAGQSCATSRAAALGDLAPVSVRRGEGWVAVRTSAASNDLNVVLGEPGFVPDADLLGTLLRWLGEVPASWQVRAPDAALSRALTAAGWTPERTGRWCGRELAPVGAAPGEVVVSPVADAGDLEDWLDVAQACDWLEDTHDRGVRRALAEALEGEPRHRAWVARLGERPVGMATGWYAAPCVEVVDVAVLEDVRRRGVGGALVGAVLAWGAAWGAREVVAAPSPEGWRLFESLGFDNVPAEPDVCFYAPDGRPRTSTSA